jgi:cardiolipin synthase
MRSVPGQNARATGVARLTPDSCLLAQELPCNGNSSLAHLIATAYYFRMMTLDCLALTVTGHDTTWSWVVAPALHVLSFILVCVDCLRQRREAASTLLWIFVAWTFPVVGPLIYLYFGLHRVPRKGFKKHTANQRFLAERQAREEETLPLAYWRAVHDAGRVEPPTAVGRDMNQALDRLLPNHHLLGGNAITPLVDGDGTFPEFRRAIRQAQHHIHLQSFIIGNDIIGREMLGLLAERAEHGIEVRIMYDRFGSAYAVLRGLFRRYRGTPNLQLAGWTQANLLKKQFQVNLRNHRKVLVIDGREAFMGGINLSAENVTSGKGPPIRDYHFMIRGPVVQELQYAFMQDWHFITGEDPGEILQEIYFPHIDAEGAALTRLINSGPGHDLARIRDAFFLSFMSARRQILAVTPYFVPPREILQALRSASLRGVDVRLVIPAKGNHIYAALASRALYEELLWAGVRIFERREPFLHAKAVIVDDAFALVGTANLDARSLHLNYETNMVVHDDTFVNALKEIVLADLAQSDEVTLDDWKQRPTRQKIKENLAYLMMPVL